MANQEHLDVLKQGKDAWNQWRKEHVDIKPDLSGEDLYGLDFSQANLSRTNINDANLSGTNFRKANLSSADLLNAKLFGANLSNANLRRANLSGATLSRAILISTDLSEADLSIAKMNMANLTRAILHDADLSGAYLHNVDLTEADLSNAILTEVDLSKAILFGANLSGAILTGADLGDANLSRTNLSKAILNKARLVNTNLEKADLTGCSIYGISAWNDNLEDAIQENLIITLPTEPVITVDDLEIAQFIYLLLNNKKIRNVIDTITSKVVLILGRFTPERKKVLNALRDELRKKNYLPIIFDFEKPASRDVTETMSILAHLARFIIVDLTDPSSAPHEVATIVPQCIVPIQPLLLRDDTNPRYEYAMFHDLRTRYHWVLPTYQYKDIASLLASLKENLIDPAEQKAKELAQR